MFHVEHFINRFNKRSEEHNFFIPFSINAFREMVLFPKNSKQKFTVLTAFIFEREMLSVFSWLCFQMLNMAFYSS